MQVTFLFMALLFTLSHQVLLAPQNTMLPWPSFMIIHLLSCISLYYVCVCVWAPGWVFHRSLSCKDAHKDSDVKVDADGQQGLDVSLVHSRPLVQTVEDDTQSLQEKKKEDGGAQTFSVFLDVKHFIFIQSSPSTAVLIVSGEFRWLIHTDYKQTAASLMSPPPPVHFTAASSQSLITCFCQNHTNANSSTDDTACVYLYMCTCTVCTRCPHHLMTVLGFDGDWAIFAVAGLSTVASHHRHVRARYTQQTWEPTAAGNKSTITFTPNKQTCMHESELISAELHDNSSNVKNKDWLNS